MGMVRIVLLLFMLICSQTVFAFDENRKGFILGLGAGLHTTDIDFINSGVSVSSDSEAGLATSFKIGWGFTTQFSLYYVRNASWYSAPFFDGFTISDTIFTLGISGAGISYYFKPTAPSFYVLGALGVGDLSAPFESNVETDTGDAYMLGGGYEMSKHVLFELTWLDADIDSADLSTLKVEGSSIQFTVNYMWY